MLVLYQKQKTKKKTKNKTKQNINYHLCTFLQYLPQSPNESSKHIGHNPTQYMLVQINTI